MTDSTKRVVGVIGVGNVGLAAAYSIFQQNIASELVLVDLDRKRAEGEAMDLMHGQSFVGRVVVRAGGFEDLADAQIIVVTAGVGQKPGESRLDLLNRNAAVFSAIAKELDTHAPDAHIVVASNPVDILTFVMQELSARPNQRIVGTGTMLDTSRFRSLLGEYYGISPRSVHAYILGEHGDSEFPAWSKATIGGRPIRDNVVLGKTFDHDAMDAIFEHVRNAAYEIIERKGYTSSAIGLVIARLVDVILRDQRSVWPVSVRLEGEYGLSDLCISVPSVVGADGTLGKVQLELDAKEQEALEASAAVLKESLQAISL